MEFKRYRLRAFCKWIAEVFYAYPTTPAAWEKRNAWLRRTGMKIEPGAAIGKGLFSLPMNEQNIQIKENTAIGYNVRLYAFNEVVIGSFNMIAAEVVMTNGGHDKNDFTPASGPLVIGNGCWIATGAKIIGPLTIGNNVIVGAGAVVIEDIPDDAIVVGIPAKIIGYRTLPDKVWHFGGTWFSPKTFCQLG